MVLGHRGDGVARVNSVGGSGSKVETGLLLSVASASRPGRESRSSLTLFRLLVPYISEKCAEKRLGKQSILQS